MHVHDPRTGRTFFSKRRRSFEKEKLPHELTFSCYRRFRFLEKDRTRVWFVEALEKARKALPVDLWAYVIMPEHVHLIVAPQTAGVSVGRFRGMVKEEVARKAIKWLQQHAPQWVPKITVYEGERVRRRFWQPGGGYDRIIEQVDTLYAMIQYIHMNPVRRGLVERPEAWEWSSALWYAGLAAHIEMDRTLPTLEE